MVRLFQSARPLPEWAKPLFTQAGRRKSTLSESVIVAFAALRSFPNGSTIKSTQSLCARLHIREAAQPEKEIGMVEHAELTDDPHTNCLLSLDKLPIKKVHEVIALSRMELVLSELNDRVISCRF